MKIGFGWYALGGLFLVLVVVRILCQKPSFIPQESCWQCLSRRLGERLRRWLPGYSLRRVLAIIILGAILGSITVIEYRAWQRTPPGPWEATSTRG